MTVLRSAVTTGKRCTLCVLPESIPGSRFNERGECAWCQGGFPNYHPKGEAELRSLLAKLRNPAAPADCLVGVSGGKDSSYVLMALQQHFGMRVEAFTYVHDGLTSFALRNAEAVCHTLAVQHHRVSLPDHGHLKSFQTFFEVWLETERPLAAAMTCVACKHLHILGTRLAYERRIPMIVWSACAMETPPFIPTQPQRNSGDAGRRGVLSLGGTLAKELVTEPRFRKAFMSHLDVCTQGCLAFRPGTGYLQRRYASVSHVHYFEYCPWNETEIVSALHERTPWRVPPEVLSDWHSDCLFNVFKEYMFQKMLGASYTDAFLSNQIRHGLMTREHGMNELQRRKRFFAAEIPRTLKVLGLGYLSERCDTSCYAIDS